MPVHIKLFGFYINWTLIYLHGSHSYTNNTYITLIPPYIVGKFLPLSLSPYMHNIQTSKYSRNCKVEMHKKVHNKVIINQRDSTKKICGLRVVQKSKERNVNKSPVTWLG